MINDVYVLCQEFNPLCIIVGKYLQGDRSSCEIFFVAVGVKRIKVFACNIFPTLHKVFRTGFLYRGDVGVHVKGFGCFFPALSRG